MMHGEPCQREQEVLTPNPNDIWTCAWIKNPNLHQNVTQNLIKTATDVSQMLGTWGFPINWWYDAFNWLLLSSFSKSPTKLQCSGVSAELRCLANSSDVGSRVSRLWLHVFGACVCACVAQTGCACTELFSLQLLETAQRNHSYIVWLLWA